MAINAAYDEIISASSENRRDLFLRTSQRLGTTLQNTEKDFWVCWTLDVLFNGLPSGTPRLLFKGGTSLSKAYGLISRFSEDIDITVFRQDLGRGASVEDLEKLSGKKRQAQLDAIKESCKEFILGDLRREFERVISGSLAGGHDSTERVQITADDADHDGQTLLVSYPTVAEQDGRYIRSAVKIESGAKSALDPNRPAVITPYIALDTPDLTLEVPNVTTIEAERTFWDKVVILHGQRSWFVRRGSMRQDGHRVSRHYYDIHQLLQSDVGGVAVADLLLAVDCARHARTFFNSPDFDLEHAVPGTLAIAPTEKMLDPLHRDYEAMAGMIFGTVPRFDDVIESIRGLESRVNADANN